jgi:ubiquinone/menaquinone biosynthesis C-methylase UbiE
MLHLLSKGKTRDLAAGQTDQPMDWSVYAQQYDAMCDGNPYYTNNIATLLQRLEAWRLPKDAVICDIGAGTGNFIYHIAPLMPEARLVHIDSSHDMNATAKVKYASKGYNVEVVEEYVQRLDYPAETFDLVICVHALYAMNPQSLILRKIHRWMKPHGRLFLIDLGRKMNPVDWGLHLLRKSIRKREFLKHVGSMLSNKEVFRQNRLTALGQNTGQYWLHDTIEFGNILERCGFEVEELDQCYRGYSDLAICKRNKVFS